MVNEEKRFPAEISLNSIYVYGVGSYGAGGGSIRGKG